MTQRLKLFGPPGTGKTRYLLERFQEELKRVRPDRIAFLTFTRAARQEALQRTGRSEKDLPFLKTIHSICYRQMAVSQSQMIKPKHLQELGKKLGVEITGWSPNLLDEESFTSDGKATKADRLLNLNHLGRHRKVGLREMLNAADDADLEWEFSKWFTEAYRKWKEAESMYDFTDLLTVYLKHGQALPIDVMIVDEAQDLSRLQWDVVHKLGARAARTYIAGDDDQAIFTWAGASAEAFITEKCDQEVILEQSMRCPKAVMRVAHSIITNVQRRVKKNTLARDAEGSFSTVGYLDEKDFQGDTFLLYRNHHRGRSLAKELEDMSIPYLGTSSPLSQGDVRRALSAWDHETRGERVSSAEAKSFMDMADARLLTKDADKHVEEGSLGGILKDRSSLERGSIDTLSRLPSKLYLRNILDGRSVREILSPSLTLQSIHQSKGQQADTVVLDTELARKTFDGMMSNPDDEHRVWYVGATRAKERLVALLPMNQLHYQI